MSEAIYRDLNLTVGSVEWAEEIQRLGPPYPTLLPDEFSEVEYDQVGRFRNSSDIVRYVCAFEPFDHPSKRNYFDPFCPFPYINAGWKLPVVNESNSVVFNDCSMLISDSSQTYNSICAWYAGISAVPLIFLIFYLYQINERLDEKKKRKPFFVIKRPNTGEQLIYWTSYLSFIHTVMCIDMLGFAGRIPVWLGDLCMGSCYAMAIAIMSTLVTGWVTIIDGGKKKKTPRWALFLKWTSVITVFFAELCGTYLERRIGNAARYTPWAMDGNTTLIRYIVFMVFYSIYGVVCFLYGLRIIVLLSAGKSGLSSQAKRIKRMCFGASFLALCLVGLKLYPIAWLYDATVIFPIPCNEIPADQFINLSILFFQYALTWVTRPSLAAKKKVNPQTGSTKKESNILFRSNGSSASVSSEVEENGKGTNENGEPIAVVG